MSYLYKSAVKFLIVSTMCSSSLIPENSSSDAGTISAMDSDFFVIQRDASTLPVENIGQGVFAKIDIKNQAIICEYRGPIISNQDSSAYMKGTKNDKIFDIIGPDGNKYHIIGENICAYINDCTSIMNRTYSEDDIKLLDQQLAEGSSGVPCYEGFGYNSAALTHWETGKLFVVANRDIKAGEEIFYSYGYPYWRGRIISKS